MRKPPSAQSSIFIDHKKMNGNLFPVEVMYCFASYEIAVYRDELFAEFGVYFEESLASAVIKRKAEFLAGRIVAGNLLEKAGTVNFDIRIGESRAPVWPEGIKGSISHTDQHVLAVISKEASIAGLGVDIEPVLSADKLSLARNIIYNQELEFFNNFDDERKQCEFLTIAFSVKEAFFKAAFPLVKEYFNFDAVRIDEICLASGKAVLVLQKEQYRSLFAGLTVNAAFNFTASDCISICYFQRRDQA